MKGSKRPITLITLLCISIIGINTSSKLNFQDEQYLDEEKVNSKALSIQLQTHAPILIDSNNDFHNQAASEGWDLSGTRNGTASKPYVIADLNMTGLLIMNTNLNFEISNCYIYGGALSLDNVTNGKISNTIVENSEHGIFLSANSSRNLIKENRVSYNKYSGIMIFSSNNNTIIDNDVFMNNLQASAGDVGGIIVTYSDFNNITNNYVYNNYQHGIRLYHSRYNLVSGNYVFNNQGDGIYFQGSANNTIADTWINNNNNVGIYVWASSNNTVIKNNISENNYGINIGYDIYDDRFIPRNNLVSNNDLNNNILYDLILIMYSEDNIISMNNFLGTPKVRDDGDNNSFSYNHWSNWTSPDIDIDFIVDNPFSISGSANNADPYPRVFSFQFIWHSPIYIDGNSNFISKATIEEWPGNGSNSNPFIIRNYYFSNLSTILINIVNVDLYFRIENCLFKEGDIGIYLTNVINADISKNILINNSFYGIRIASSSNINIIKNTVYNPIKDYSDGIVLEKGSTSNNIINNTIFNCAYGIVLKESANSNVYDNNIFRNIHSGILVQTTENSIISNNNIHNNTLCGLELQDTINITVSDNYVFNNSEYGIQLQDSSKDSEVWKNSIFYNKRGINLKSANDTIISCNEVHHNSYCGIYVTNYAMNNSIKFNNLVNNDQYQAYDEGGLNTIFAFNYWNNWVSPDDNFDGIVDDPLLIDGPANNYDYYPITISTTAPIHLLSSPSIFFPNKGEILFGTIVIEWAPTVDAFDHNISYSVFFSDNNGISWDLLIQNLSSTNFSWDTTNIIDSFNCLIKVVVTCSEGSSVEDISDSTVTIDNYSPKIALIALINNTIISPSDIIKLDIIDVSLDVVWYNWDDGDNQSFIDPWQISPPTSEGYHWLSVYAKDSVGRTTVKKYCWYIIPPTTTTPTTTTPTTPTTTPTTTTSIPSTSRSDSAPEVTPGFGLIPLIMGLLAVIVLFKRLKR